MKPKLAKKQLNSVITRLRQALKTHGGDLTLVTVDDESVTVRLDGACSHCPLAAITFSQGVERTLLEEVEGLKRVILDGPNRS